VCVGVWVCAHAHTDTSNTLADGFFTFLSSVLSFSPYEGHLDFSE